MKRKNHFTGINPRKFIGMKKSKLMKKALKNPAVKAGGRSKLERVLNGFSLYFSDLAKDRPNYSARFFATWQAALDSIRAAAEKMLAEPTFVPIPDEPGLFPYSILFLSIFSRLMDNLTYEEEASLRDILTRMDGAWGLYLSVVRMRWPKLSSTIDRAAEIRECLQLEVQRLFFGEVAPALTQRWSLAYSGLKQSIELLTKEASHELA